MKKFLLFIFCSSVTFSAYAAMCPSWKVTENGTVKNYGSLASACSARVAEFNRVDENNVYTLLGDDGVKTCSYEKKRKSDGQVTTANYPLVTASVDCSTLPENKCKSGDQIAMNNFGIKWSNQKSGMIVPMYPPTPMCKGGCEVTVVWSNNFRFKDTSLEKNDWKLLADDAVLTKTGNECSTIDPTDPPPPESPPGMNCGYYNGHQVCMGKDKTYVCKKTASGQTACLPTQDLEKGQVCGDVDGKYVCMDLNDPKADICEKQEDGSMNCLPKENLYENNTGSDSGKTDGDDAGTTESDKDTAVTPGTSAPDASRGWGEKYDKGLGGIWMVKTKEMQNTDIVKFAKKIMPTDLNSGARPSWTIEFEVPVIGYVSHDIDVPGEVWAGLKMIVLAMASIFAFRLIFGGA